MNAPPSSSAFMLTEQPKNREKGRKSMVFRTYDGNALALSPSPCPMLKMILVFRVVQTKHTN